MDHPPLIDITINGHPRNFVPGTNLRECVECFSEVRARGAVFINKKFIPKDQYDSTAVHQGDSINIVYFLGGG